MSTPISQPEYAVKDYKTDMHPIWCPGCGDFGVLASLYSALAGLQVQPKDLVVVSGIGCSGRTAGFVRSYGFHTVHGRVLPVALGVKVANPGLTVIGVGGDGDGFAIGGGHIPHMARRNPDMTYIIMDNQVYGLTKGQYSPTSAAGYKAGSTPYGSVDEPVNPIALLIAYGASFVAQGYSGKPQQLAELIHKAIEHKGFSFVNVISPCITFFNTYKMVPARLKEIPKGHDIKSRAKAFELALHTEDISLGVFYEAPRPTFEEGLATIQKQAQAAGSAHLEQVFSRFA